MSKTTPSPLTHTHVTHVHTHDAYQLLNDALHKGGEGHIIVLAVVIEILDQLRDDLCVCVRLKLIAFGNLSMGWDGKAMVTDTSSGKTKHVFLLWKRGR